MSTTRKYDEATLPEGWRMVRVGDLVGMSQGGTPRKEEPSYWDGAIPFLTGADLTDFRVGRHHARSFLTAAGLASGQTARCESGTLLLTTRTRVGLAGMATELMGASQDITCLMRTTVGINGDHVWRQQSSAKRQWQTSVQSPTFGKGARMIQFAAPDPWTLPTWVIRVSKQRRHDGSRIHSVPDSNRSGFVGN